MCLVLLTNSVLFLTEVLLVRFMFFLINLSRCLAILWEGACVLFINGLMGVLGLRIFGNAFSCGGVWFDLFEVFDVVCLDYVFRVIYEFVYLFLIFQCGVFI